MTFLQFFVFPMIAFILAGGIIATFAYGDLEDGLYGMFTGFMFGVVIVGICNILIIPNIYQDKVLEYDVVKINGFYYSQSADPDGLQVYNIAYENNGKPTVEQIETSYVEIKEGDKAHIRCVADQSKYYRGLGVDPYGIEGSCVLTVPRGTLEKN